MVVVSSVTSSRVPLFTLFFPPRNMFDRPNKDAFFVVFHFLFAKLDSARCKEVLR